MIERYTRKEMAQLWTPETRFSLWLKVELAVLEIEEQLGIVPQGVTQRVRPKATFNVQRIDEIEAEVKHDVIAFLTSVNENLGDDGRFLHYGMTSSDLIDTALALQLGHAGQLILAGLTALTQTMKTLAFKHKETPMIGRSHGIHAEPITFGFKVLGWLDELERQHQRLEASLENLRVGQISGPVGSYSAITPKVEALVCEKLGLKPSKVSTQVLPRDLHAAFLTDLALLASSIERWATELRHLQRTEVLEVEEGFSKGQKGSSAMPHKRNPISGENLTGLARMVRSYALPMMENIALWHERDISHSSVERVVLPDATILMDYMIHRLNGVLENLLVHPENMKRNLYFKGGLAFSQQVLLALVEKGLLRETAYRVVQRCAMAAWQAEDGNFQALLKQDPDVLAHLTPADVEACFDLEYALRHINDVFARFDQPVTA